MTNINENPISKNSKVEFPHCRIVILNYNGQPLLKRFLPSVVQLDYPNFDVYVVDNASRDDSVSFLRSKYPDIKVIVNRENFGTAAGYNVALPAKNSEYILCLSNDMELDPLLLKRMIKTAKSSEKIGICTCKNRRLTVEGEKLNTIDNVGGDLDFLGFPYPRGHNEADEGQLDDTHEVFFSFGGAMLIKGDVIRKIGGNDPAFFTLTDDIDLSWRARLVGFEVVAEPSALLYHRVSATLGSIFGRGQRRFLSERNTLRMLLKNYSTSTLFNIIPLYLGMTTSEVFLFVVLRKFSLVKAYLKAISWNLTNFRETWSQHVLIQEIRTISDKEIRKIMYPKSYKVRIFKEFITRRKNASWVAFFGENVEQKDKRTPQTTRSLNVGEEKRTRFRS